MIWCCRGTSKRLVKGWWHQRSILFAAQWECPGHGQQQRHQEIITSQEVKIAAFCPVEERCPDMSWYFLTSHIFPAFWYWTFDLMWPARKSLQSTEAPGSPLPWRFSAAFVKTSEIWAPTVPRVADRSARTHLRWWLQALSMGKWLGLGLKAEQLWLTPQAAGKWLLYLSCDVECTWMYCTWDFVGVSWDLNAC